MGENAVWGKFTTTEYATRVPMMIRIPGTTDHGMEISNLVELVDLFPSLVEAAGKEREVFTGMLEKLLLCK